MIILASIFTTDGQLRIDFEKYENDDDVEVTIRDIMTNTIRFQFEIDIDELTKVIEKIKDKPAND